MKITYDEQLGAVYLTVRPDTTIAHSIEVQKNVVLDLDADGEVVGIELLDANQDQIVLLDRL